MGFCALVKTDVNEDTLLGSKKSIGPSGRLMDGSWMILRNECGHVSHGHDEETLGAYFKLKEMVAVSVAGAPRMKSFSKISACKNRPTSPAYSPRKMIDKAVSVTNHIMHNQLKGHIPSRLPSHPSLRQCPDT